MEDSFKMFCKKHGLTPSKPTDSLILDATSANVEQSLQNIYACHKSLEKDKPTKE